MSKFKNTTIYRNIETLGLYKRCYQNLVGNGIPLSKPSKGKHDKKQLIYTVVGISAFAFVMFKSNMGLINKFFFTGGKYQNSSIPAPIQVLHK